MKKLRFLTLLLLSAMIVIMFAACGAEEPSLYQPGQVSTEAPTTEAPTTEAPTTEAPTTEAPTTEAPTTEAPTTEAPEIGDPLEVGAKWYVNTDTLNVRSGPSTEHEAVASLYRGEQVLIMSIQGEWLQIKSATADGFVNKNFLVATYKETGLSGQPPKDPEEEPVAQEQTPAAVVSTEPPATEAPVASGNGHIVCIDAGHQQAGISEQEPNGPGSTVMKAKLTTGTQGCATGIPEHQINLQVALLLKQELLNRGYQVVMIRETADCPQSNAERAQIANNSGAEIFVRIHCNSSNNPDVTGAQFYAPSPANPYMNGNVVTASNTLSAVMLDSFCAATGAINRGVLQDDGMTGINWCTVPVTIAEMGFMSNPNEDRLLADAGYQAKMVQGMANGIDRYFGR